MTKFEVINNETKRVYGIRGFNGTFVFDLNDEIDLDDWNRAGFVRLAASRHVESDDLFWYLNSRLPIRLRDKSNKEKLDYIKRSGLKVASDNFELVPID